jgi:hypothetical protein
MRRKTFNVDSIHFPINSKIRGISLRSRQRMAKRCKPGLALKLVREKKNEHDGNAIAVHKGGLFGGQLGYISADLAEQLAPAMDSGTKLRAVVLDRTGGDGFLFWRKAFGVNISIERL